MLHKVAIAATVLGFHGSPATPFHHHESFKHKIEQAVIPGDGHRDQHHFRHHRERDEHHHRERDFDDGDPLAPMSAERDGHFRSDGWEAEFGKRPGGFKCEMMRIAYYARHFDGKPRSLTGEFGCHLYADDYYYHSTLHNPLRLGY